MINEIKYAYEAKNMYEAVIFFFFFGKRHKLNCVLEGKKSIFFLYSSDADSVAATVAGVMDGEYKTRALALGMLVRSRVRAYTE